MLNALTASTHRLQRIDLAAGERLPDDAVWIDLLEPIVEEEQLVERTFKIDVPTREEMREIETSNRLYEENGTLYMTMTVAAKLDTDRPESAAVTFILTQGRLVTNRYVDTKPFRNFASYCERNGGSLSSGAAVLTGLIEASVQRIADVLERVGSDLDAMSGTIFNSVSGRAPASGDLRDLMERIGFSGELDSKARESLVSLGRLLMFVQQSQLPELSEELRGRLRSSNRDVLALSDYATFLAGKVTFLLEATLGLINIEQNNIIKIFSVAAVMFLPPTFIASVYGMNFHHMPELDWHVGYPFALLVMILSAVVPYWWFKRKGWL
ncbi:MAG TPA: magnesium transporter CorA family protein [Steroidobacteraceae bacterium]|nr:magnesium transporter CorA family protein [Steroidobacteraceae bacterium]